MALRKRAPAPAATVADSESERLGVRRPGGPGGTVDSSCVSAGRGLLARTPAWGRSTTHTRQGDRRSLVFTAKGAGRFTSVVPEG